MKSKQNKMKKIIAGVLSFVMFCTVISILPDNQASAKTIVGGSTSNPQTYGDWYDVVPENGNFEAGYVGMDVYGWHLTAMSGLSRLEDDTDNYTQEKKDSYIKAYSLKTEAMEDGNKVAALKKTNAGYIALTSQPFVVEPGEVYQLQYNYFLKNIKNTASTIKDSDIHGIVICMREYDADGNATWTKLSNDWQEGEGQVAASDYTVDETTGVGTYTSEAWSTVNVGFVTRSTTVEVELYFRFSAQGYVTGSVLFDNISVSEYEYYELPNGDFKGVTYLSEGGRVDGTAGPAGWTLLTCEAGGATYTTTYDHTKSYVAAIVADPDAVEYNPVMKYQYKTNASTGYAFIQSPSVPVKAGDTFFASFRYKIVGQMAYTPKATVFFYDSSGNEISRVHTSLNKSQETWLEATTLATQVVPDGAVMAKIGFFGSRNNSVSSASYPEEYIYTDGTRNYDTYELYFDDVVINGEIQEWTVETTKTNGVVRTDIDSTEDYAIEQVEDDTTGHKNAWKLYASSTNNGYGCVVFYSKPISIQASTLYTTTFDLKITGFEDTATGSNSAFQARYFLRYLDISGNVLNSTPYIVYSSGYTNRDWTSYNANFTTPSDAVALQVGLLAGVVTKNTWNDVVFTWDNIRIMETTEYESVMVDKFDDTDLLFLSMQGGNADEDTETLDVRDMVRIMRYMNRDELGEIAIQNTADMNRNKQYNEDDIQLLRWKMLGLDTEEKIQSGVLSAADVLNNQQILFCGDSITAGASGSNNLSWADKVAELTGAVATNAGVGGATVAYDRSNVDTSTTHGAALVEKSKIIDQLHNNQDGDFDYVILHGGVNDAGNVSNIPVGVVSDSYTLTDFDGTTFAGGLESMFYYAHEYFPHAKIGFIVNYQTVQEHLGTYMDVAKQICDKWNVPYLDLYSGTVIVDGQELSYSLDILNTDEGTYLVSPPNDVHINEEGYNAISPYIADWIATLTDNVNPIPAE